MGKLFGTDGIRGKAHEYPVTTAMAERLGHCVVKMLGSQILVGRDTRESGLALENALVAGITKAGGDAIRLGVMPSPAVALLVREMKADAGVMLTASHNPFSDNGMKVFGSGGFKLCDETELEVEELLLARDPPKDSEVPGSTIDLPDGGRRYAESVRSSIAGTDLTGLTLVLDAGNGSGSVVGPMIFRELGAKVIEMAVAPDGRNINDGCGALYAEKAGMLVKEQGADLGISFDGDADRVIFTNSRGEVVSGDSVMAMCAIALKRAGRLRGDAIVATVMSNLGLDEALRGEGISVHRSGVGDRLVLAMMREKSISFGGENSGHLIFADHATTGDAIVSAMQICRLMKETGKSIAELSSVMTAYPSTLKNIPVQRKTSLDSFPGLQEIISEADAAFGNEGRHLIRYSGTENKIRILVEHSDAAMVDLWIRRFSDVIRREMC